jgi:site-specific DNA-cytosine methylase
MRVLIACEFSGIVRDVFIAKGHDAMSCDLLPTERPGPHYQGHIEDIICDYREWVKWDLLIAFPPCTHLAASGARWFKYKIEDGSQQKAINLFKLFTTVPIAKIAIENPIGIMSTRYRKPDQIIQPWMFGHGETKATCLWLKNLPKLEPTNIVGGREPRIWKMSPSPDRGKKRSITLLGIANAMAEQWGL